jgi:hypothetical protein
MTPAVEERCGQCLAGPVSLAAGAFESGDRWCALGDSITEGGYYHRYVELFYLTRFPQRKLDVVDCGIRGDTAPRATQRVQWDCLWAKPSVVSVMLGMNDVGWNLIRLPAPELVPFTRELNQELLQVRGLAPGDYALSIDGKTIRTIGAAQWAEGINLAVEPDAPQLRQSLTVHAALQQKWKAQGALRGIAFIEHNVWPEANRPLAPGPVADELDAGLQKIAGGNPGWRVQLKKNYLEAKPREAELKRELETAVAAARQAAQTKPHEFVLRRVVSRPGRPSESAPLQRR